LNSISSNGSTRTNTLSDGVRDFTVLDELGLNILADDSEILIFAVPVLDQADLSSDTIESNAIDIDFFQDAVGDVLTEIDGNIEGLIILSGSINSDVNETVVSAQTFVDRSIIFVVADTHNLSIGNKGTVTSLLEGSNQVELVVQINRAQNIIDTLGVDNRSVSDESGQSGIQGSADGNIVGRILRDSFTSLETEPLGTTGEVNGDSSDILVKSSGNHELRTDEELSLEAQEDFISGEIEEEGSEDRTSLLVSDEDGIVELQDGVSELQGSSGGCQDSGAEGVGFLVNGIDLVVVSHEGIESTELHPSGAQFDISITSETANISTNHGDTKDLEVEELRDGQSEHVPVSSVITSPVSSPLASSDKGGTGQDEGSLLGDVVDALVGNLTFIEGVEVVEVEFEDASVM